MSKKFDTDAYVSRWDDILIPIMLVVIVASLIGVYAMNVMAKPDCITHDYVFCGTPLDQPAEHHPTPGHSEHEAADPHAPAGGAGHDAPGHDHGHPH